MKKVVMIFGLLLVSLFLAGCAKEGALAGEAYKQSKTDCAQFERCGFVTKEELKPKLDCIAESYFPPTYTKSGTEFCKDSGGNREVVAVLAEYTYEGFNETWYTVSPGTPWTEITKNDPNAHFIVICCGLK